MSQTDNGYPARADLPLRKFVVNGVAFIPGIADNDDVETVLRYCMEQYAKRVEPLRSPGCWGFAYRANRNANSLSRHSGGIAVDANAPNHPNGVPTARTFTAKQIATCHAILAEVDHTVRWGGDYTRTPDAMHWEIDTDPQTLHATAERLRGDTMNPAQETLLKDTAATVKALAQDVAGIENSLLEFRRAFNVRDKASQVREIEAIRQGIAAKKSNDQIADEVEKLREGK